MQNNHDSKVPVASPTPKREEHISAAKEIMNDITARDILECLLMCKRVSIGEISELTEVKTEVIEEYRDSFFPVHLLPKLKLISYLENGLKNAKTDEETRSFLLKRWTFYLGEEFVFWRFKLKEVVYATSSLYNTVLQELFFFHQERAMGKDTISTAEYIRSANSVIAGLAKKSNIKEESLSDTAMDILESINLVIKDRAMTGETIADMDGDFIINSRVN